VLAVLEHHFNNHTVCGPWCHVKLLQGKEREEAKLNYRSKVKNKKFYLQVKQIFDDFVELVHEMMHRWDTNIVEGLNKCFTKFLPKDRTYARTIENKERLCLVVAIDSQGYINTYQQIAEKTGLTLTLTHEELNRQLDNTKSYRRVYRKEDGAKRRRMQKDYAKLKEMKYKLAKENRKDLFYATGTSGPFPDDAQQQKQAPKRKRKERINKENVMCPHCGKKGHLQKSLNQCLKNKNYVEKETEVEDGKASRKKGMS
jgi:hypothetical protein